MKSETQPLGIAADAKLAKSRFFTRSVRFSPETNDIRDCNAHIDDAEEHEKPLGRIVSVDSGLYRRCLKPSLGALSKRVELPAEHLLKK